MINKKTLSVYDELRMHECTDFLQFVLLNHPEIFNEYGGDCNLSPVQNPNSLNSLPQENGVSVPNSYDTDVRVISFQQYADLAAAAKNDKIAAIKCIRSITGLGLRESKELIEEWFPNSQCRSGRF